MNEKDIRERNRKHLMSGIAQHSDIYSLHQPSHGIPASVVLRGQQTAFSMHYQPSHESKDARLMHGEMLPLAITARLMHGQMRG